MMTLEDGCSNVAMIPGRRNDLEDSVEAKADMGMHVATVIETMAGNTLRSKWVALRRPESHPDNEA
jgi:hypothetical protein